MFKANKEDTKTISKYFSKLIIRAPLFFLKELSSEPYSHLTRLTSVGDKTVYVVMQSFSNSFENFHNC